VQLQSYFRFAWWQQLPLFSFSQFVARNTNFIFCWFAEKIRTLGIVNHGWKSVLRACMAYPTLLYCMASCRDLLWIVDLIATLRGMLSRYQGLQRLLWTLCHLASRRWIRHCWLQSELPSTLSGSTSEIRDRYRHCNLFYTMESTENEPAIDRCVCCISMFKR
jgi:hypothetical protein